MRENKFRGISTRTNEFVYGGLVRGNEIKGNCWAIKDTVYNINNGKCDLIPEVVQPETVGQFTELKDHNGKEIYEGDILTPSAYTGLKQDTRFKCEVIFKKGMFCFAIRKPFIDKTGPLYLSLDRSNRAGNGFIVVGNMHETPELLQDA